MDLLVRNAVEQIDVRLQRVRDDDLRAAGAGQDDASPPLGSPEG